jgi:hypothetical protein
LEATDLSPAPVLSGHESDMGKLAYSLEENSQNHSYGLTGKPLDPRYMQQGYIIWTQEDGLPHILGVMEGLFPSTGVTHRNSYEVLFPIRGL